MNEGTLQQETPPVQQPMTGEEKVKHLEGEMKKAKEEGSEVYLNYLQRIYDNTITININQGGTLVMQQGSPPPLPPYKQ